MKKILKEMKVRKDGKLITVENGVKGRDDLVAFADDQYTECGTRNRREKTVNLLTWFSSENNDSYIVESDSGEYFLLLTNGPTTAYPKNEVMKNQRVKIGNIVVEEYEDEEEDDAGWMVTCGRWNKKFDTEAEAWTYVEELENNEEN